MNTSLPPEDERREEHEDGARGEVPNQAPPRFGWGSFFGLLAVVGIAVILLLPAIQSTRTPAPRSMHAEFELRQQAIEQAAREASDEDRLADNR